MISDIYYECILIQRRHYEASNLVACDRCKPFDGLIEAHPYTK